MLDDILAGTGTPGPADDFWYEPLGQATHAGIAVTPETAMRFSTVMACIVKNAKTLATLPVHVYEKRGPRETHPVDHPLNEILTWQGNRRGTGIGVRAAMYANRLAWGNGVSEITYTNGGKVAALTPLMSKWLKPVFADNGDLLWEHHPNGQYDTTLTPEKYLHDPGPFVLDGVLGVSPIQSKETIAGAMAAETFANTFFGNGAQPGGFLEFPAGIGLDDERQDALVQQFNRTWQGASRAHRVGRLREGVTFNQVGMPNQDMQLLELRKFNRIEICSIFDTPPVMIQELDPGKYTAIEQAMIAWVRDSLLPQCKATEAVLKRQFFPDSRLYVRHNLAGLARGDMEARSKFYAAGVQWGWFSINDVREWEELNSVPGGDQVRVPLNTIALTEDGTAVVPTEGGTARQVERQPPPVIVVNVPAESREADAGAFASEVAEAIAEQAGHTTQDAVAVFGPLFAEAAGRVVTKEERSVNAALKRYESKQEAYDAWCDEWFQKHADCVRQELEPVVCSMERLTGQPAGERPADFGSRYAEHQLQAARGIAGGAALDTSYLLAELTKTYLETE